MNPLTRAGLAPACAAMAWLACAHPAAGEPAPGPRPDAAGRPAITAANQAARTRSTSAAFKGGLQVFRYRPGAVYEIWTAPLRVTTLTLSPGEDITAISAGDTVRWQIAQTTSGQGGGQRTHVLVKPFEVGLETNLVLTTNRRVYLAQLRSGGPASFNAAVAWEADALDGPQASPLPTSAPQIAPVPAPPPPFDARYRIKPSGRPPAWTPSAVMTDGTRTFIAFPPALSAVEAPLLFALAPSGAPQLVNYRQQDGLYVVDQVLASAELRQGSGGRGGRVRITYRGGGAAK